jgi:DNA-binding transcriptional LysR family regulator
MPENKNQDFSMYQYYEWFRSFHTVARTGSYALAAEYLSVRRPIVFEQVSALEKSFSVELFHRRGRSFELSSIGRQLFAITRGLFDQEDETVQPRVSPGNLRKGSLRVGAVSPPIAMNIIYALMHHYPDIELKTFFNTESTTLERLYNFDIDVAILAHSEFDQRLYTHLYRRYPIIAVVPEDHPWVQQCEVTVNQIGGEKLVLREGSSRTRQLVEEGCRKLDVELNCVMQLNSREAIVHAISQNMGIGFVSEVEYVGTPGTRPIIFADHPFHIEYYLCCLDIHRARPLIAELLYFSMTPYLASH